MTSVARNTSVHSLVAVTRVPPTPVTGTLTLTWFANNKCSGRQRGASFVKELSFIDDGLWGFEVTDAVGYVLAFFWLRND